MKFGSIQLNVQALKNISEDEFLSLVKGRAVDASKAWAEFLIQAEKLGRKKPVILKKD